MADPLITGFPDIYLWTGDIIILAFREKRKDPRLLLRNVDGGLQLDNTDGIDANDESCRYIVKTMLDGNQPVFALAPQNTDGPVYVGFTDDGSKLIPQSSEPTAGSVTKFVANFRPRDHGRVTLLLAGTDSQFAGVDADGVAQIDTTGKDPLPLIAALMHVQNGNRPQPPQGAYWTRRGGKAG